MGIGRTFLIAAACAATFGAAQAESYFFRAKPVVSRPQGFSFAPEQGATPGDATASAPVRISGHGGRTAAVSGDAGAAFQVCASADCSDATGWTSSPATNLSDDFYARIRVTAGPFGSQRTATLAVGDAAAAFSVSSRPADTDPDPVTIAATSNAAAGQAATSAAVKLSGHDGIPVSVSGSGASYRLCKDSTCSANPAWATAAGTASRDDWVQVRGTAPAGGTTATVATLSYGGRSATWTVASMADNCTGAHMRLTTPNGFVADVCGWTKAPKLTRARPEPSMSHMAVLSVANGCGSISVSFGGAAGDARKLEASSYSNCTNPYDVAADWLSRSGVPLGITYIVRSTGLIASNYDTQWLPGDLSWQLRNN